MICIIITINNKKWHKRNDTCFSDYWLEEYASKSSLSKAADKKQARCRICKKDFELSNMGKKALLSYAAGKKHNERDIKITFLNLQIRIKLLTIIQNVKQLKMKMAVLA